MYNAILAILIGVSILIFSRGMKSRRRGLAASGVVLFAATLVFFWFMDFWGEMLWFESLGYEGKFWKEVGARVVLGVGWAIVGALLVFLLTIPVPRARRRVRLAGAGVAAVVGGLWGQGNWEVILKFNNRVSTGLAEPILGHDTGFYLFTLPFLDALSSLFILLTLVALLFAGFAYYLRIEGDALVFRESIRDADQPGVFGIRLDGAAVLVAVAFFKWVERYHLMFSDWGVVSGPGWTDVHIRLPAYLVFCVLCLVAAAWLLSPWARKPFERIAQRSEAPVAVVPLLALGGVAVVLFAFWLVALSILPGMIQWLVVEPNEVTREKPYIAHNIEFTRHGFKLQDAEVREFPLSMEFTEEMIERNQAVFDNIRLWDWRALDAVYKQFQEIRLYYEFADVDVDRYTIAEKYRSTMISAREMELRNLPAQSQTFVNKRFKYTHGYGLTLTNVSEFTPEGLPKLLIQDIPPVSKYPEMEIEQPRIYYGELTRTPVYVNTSEEEFDYPSGERNVYTRYSGKGGVQITNFWRKFLFGWKFDGSRFLFSGYPTPESRVMFHRQIVDRVQTLAPFLRLDADPYITLVDGRQYWIIDAYTHSSYYPYSEPFTPDRRSRYDKAAPSSRLSTDLGRANYVRNSVKVVVDAYNGSVDLYVMEPDDPLITVWDKVFPGLFTPMEEMPERIRDHVRYPADMLLLQGLVYAKYHMDDPEVFYNQEDLWVRATEKYYNNVIPVQPYYVMWEMPESNEPEFVLIMPFTPKNRQVLIGWIAGMCDGNNYGRFLAYKFPKEKRVLGPQQVETKIDQDRHLSGQLSLWDQRGSSVIRGNVLAIPVENTMIYVEPIYLQAETAAYPELRLVAVMHNDNLSYAESFDQALYGLFGKAVPEKMAPGTPAGPVPGINNLVRSADDAFNGYLDALGNKRFDDAAQSLKDLRDALDSLSVRAGAAPPQAGTDRSGAGDSGS
ncbi:MAG: UPF0182 family protein [Desulfatibacillaceae bacterium]